VKYSINRSDAFSNARSALSSSVRYSSRSRSPLDPPPHPVISCRSCESSSNATGNRRIIPARPLALTRRMTHEARSEKREWESLDRYCFRDSSNDATELTDVVLDATDRKMTWRYVSRERKREGEGKASAFSFIRKSVRRSTRFTPLA